MPQSIPGHKDACMKTDESPSCHGRRLRRASTILQAALAAALYTIGLTPNAFAQDAQPAQQFVPPPVETGGADVNGDGVVDDADMTATLESFGASGLSASVTELEPCDEHVVDFPECGDLSLDDPFVGCDCEGDGGGGDGGGEPLPPSPGPDYDGFNKCQAACTMKWNNNIDQAQDAFHDNLYLCFLPAAGTGLLSGLKRWWYAPAGATAGGSAWAASVTAVFRSRMATAEAEWQNCLIDCKLDNSIPL